MNARTSAHAEAPRVCDQERRDARDARRGAALRAVTSHGTFDGRQGES